MMFIVVCCLYLLLDGADEARKHFLFGALRSAWLFYPVLVVFFLTFAHYSWSALRKVIRKRPAVRWGCAGITLSNNSRIAWAAVVKIDLMRHKCHDYVLIFLDEPVAFIDMQVGERRVEAKRCYQRFQTPVAILCSELKIDAHVLVQLLQQCHMDYRLNSLCSKP